MKLCVCDKCGINENDKKVVSLEIKDRGYGSEFDSMSFEFELCEDCINELGVNADWFDNEVNEVYGVIYDEQDPIVYHKNVFAYKNEDNIINIINSLPIEAQERILNQSTLCSPFKMDTEEWIEIYKDGFFTI